jgi:serine/threonine-protein kinase
MKLVEGRTLAALLGERQTPADDLPRFLLVFEQVCQAVGYAHSRGVVHRDLKPANVMAGAFGEVQVMVGAFGEVQVMDWGLAKALASASRGRQPPEEGGAELIPPGADAPGSPAAAGWSLPGAAIGTPAYMAPEQARGEVGRLDARCDVFGLGAMLCEILTGRPPSVGREAAEVLAAAARPDQRGALERLAACGADAGLLRLTTACLAADPADRPPDGRPEAAAELRRANEFGARDPNWRQPSADALRQAERAAESNR